MYYLTERTMNVCRSRGTQLTDDVFTCMVSFFENGKLFCSEIKESQSPVLLLESQRRMRQRVRCERARRKRGSPVIAKQSDKKKHSLKSYSLQLISLHVQILVQVLSQSSVYVYDTRLS